MFAIKHKEHFDLPYATYSINCVLTSKLLRENLTSVTIFSNANTRDFNNSCSGLPDSNATWINIHKFPHRNLLNDKNISNSMVVCVKPLFNKYNDVHRFVEFIELYKILGN